MSSPVTNRPQKIPVEIQLIYSMTININNGTLGVCKQHMLAILILLDGRDPIQLKNPIWKETTKLKLKSPIWKNLEKM